jgi:hypothetical protein
VKLPSPNPAHKENGTRDQLKGIEARIESKLHEEVARAALRFVLPGAPDAGFAPGAFDFPPITE